MNEKPADELTGLREMLAEQRAEVVRAVTGAPAAVLQSVSTSTGMTILGLVRHLAEVERSWWYDDVLGREAPHPRRPGEPIHDAAGTEDELAAYVAACRDCDDAVAGVTPDATGVGDPDVNVRWVYLHLIEETARHLGHLDLLREQADGTTRS